MSSASFSRDSIYIQPNNNSDAQIQTLVTGTISPQAFPKIAIAIDKITSLLTTNQ